MCLILLKNKLDFNKYQVILLKSGLLQMIFLDENSQEARKWYVNIAIRN